MTHIISSRAFRFDEKTALAKRRRATIVEDDRGWARKKGRGHNPAQGRFIARQAGRQGKAGTRARALSAAGQQRQRFGWAGRQAVGCMSRPQHWVRPTQLNDGSSRRYGRRLPLQLLSCARALVAGARVVCQLDARRGLSEAVILGILAAWQTRL